MKRREFVLSCIPLMVLSAITRPAFADLYDDYINSVFKKPFVSFLARESPGSIDKPGHAYIGVGVELDNGLLVYEKLLGYYPVDELTWGEIKASFSTASGELKSKIDDVAWDVEYRVDTDDTGHSKALAVADRWMASDPKYNLFANRGKNCSSFVSEIATALGLKLPNDDPGATWPVNYIQKLKAMN